MKRSGRPRKEDDNSSRTKLINAAAKLIAREGIESLTVRSVCSEAGLSVGTFYYFFEDKNDLMMSFIGGMSFADEELTAPLRDVAGRITELYMLLIRRYMNFGREFVRSFYNPRNKILSAYMGEHEGKFAPGTVMERSEQELNNALCEGIITLPEGRTTHRLAANICSIVKGCVFEWCISDAVDIESITEEIIRDYLCRYV